jgi:four helix bundle protein
MNGNLESRLVNWVTKMNNLLNALPTTIYLNTLKLQLARSTTSSALNYGEALAASSLKDFIHKLNIVLKEIKETKMGLRLIEKAAPPPFSERIQELYKESDELASIIFSSIRTSKRKLEKS